MRQILSPILCCLLSLGVAAQEIPGVRATLSSRGLYQANAAVELRLLLQVDSDAEVPADLLSGIKLKCTVDDQAGPAIDEAGKGTSVALAAGTRIERVLSFPATRFAPSLDGLSIATVAVSWHGMAGANCVFKIAPDTRNIDLAAIDHTKTQVVLITNFGEMRLSFRPDKAPKHVENFLKLCKEGFYDGTKFHRVIRDFMIQGGCPNTKDDSKVAQWGSGGPGYSINLEASDLRHLRGTLSMARTTDPNTAGSGFFIMHADNPGLDGQYSAFGNLEEGSDTLNRIATTLCGGPKRETPVQPVILHAAIILPVKK